jgi:hypothetical protein
MTNGTRAKSLDLAFERKECLEAIVNKSGFVNDSIAFFQPLGFEGAHVCMWT